MHCQQLWSSQQFVIYGRQGVPLSSLSRDPGMLWNKPTVLAFYVYRCEIRSPHDVWPCNNDRPGHMLPVILLFCGNKVHVGNTSSYTVSSHPYIGETDHCCNISWAIWRSFRHALRNAFLQNDIILLFSIYALIIFRRSGNTCKIGGPGYGKSIWNEIIHGFPLFVEWIFLRYRLLLWVSQLLPWVHWSPLREMNHLWICHVPLQLSLRRWMHPSICIRRMMQHCTCGRSLILSKKLKALPWRSLPSPRLSCVYPDLQYRHFWNLEEIKSSTYLGSHTIYVFLRALVVWT